MTNATNPYKRAFYAAIAVLLVFAGMLISPMSPVRASNGADKIGVSGGGINVTQSSTPVLLLSGTLKSSTPADLIIQATAECDIVTQVKTTNTGNQSTSSSTAVATIKLYVLLDDKVVPVSSDDTSDPGEVVFCNRSHTQTVALGGTGDKSNLVIQQFMQTRTANAFNWIRLNVGNGSHTLKLMGVFNNAGTTASNASSSGVIGKRTLVVTPVHMAPDAAI